MTGLVQTMFDGPLDVVGDVHGELDALKALLRNLGYDELGRQPDGRRLVFVGDLCDRGPDSPGVVKLVRRLIEGGAAQCILGNHELNLIRRERKDGNHWFFGDTDPKYEAKFGPCAFATPPETEEICKFFQSLPAALERPDLRVVHAAWEEKSIAACRTSAAGTLEAYGDWESALSESAHGTRLKREYELEFATHREEILNPSEAPPFMPAIAAYDEYYQNGNPVRVLTSGVETVTRHPFYAGGKWRFVEREKWWRRYEGPVPVIFGHYWRWWNPRSSADLSKDEPYLFEGDDPAGWQKNRAGREVAFCVDFSAGVRYRERKAGRRQGFEGRLAALRWPERTLVFDEGAPAVTT